MDREGTIKKVARNGDSSAKIQEFPWMMSIATIDDQKVKNHCSGTLISKKFVLTAAHCFDNVKIESLILIFGSDDLRDENQFYQVEREISETFVHPDYDPRYHYFDIALIKTDIELDFNAGIYPVCLPQKASINVDNRRGNAVTLTGYGAESRENPSNQKLRFAQLTVYSQAFCNGRYSSAGSEFERIIQETLPQKFQPNILCAGYEIQGEGSCKGDSGGPLVAYFDSITDPFYEQIAIVGGGIGSCGSNTFPGIYTRLDDFKVLDWVYRTAFEKPLSQPTVPQPRPTTSISTKGNRILVLTGSPDADSRQTEIVRTGRNGPSCGVPKYPNEIMAAVGTMVDGSPMVCGGRGYDIATASDQCYYLENGRFQITREPLPQKRFNAAAMELDGKMWLTGGRTDTNEYLYTTLLVSKTKVEYFIELPNKRAGHCMIKINETLALLAGGWNTDTHFIDLQTLEWSPGPDLPSVRFEAGCSSFKHDDATVVVIAGGNNGDGNPRTNSVIFLDTKKNQWENGPNLPVQMSAFPLLPTPDGQGLLALGGYSGAENRDRILHLDCPGSLATCQWKNWRKNMRLGRALHVAMYIPDNLDLCSK